MVSRTPGGKANRRTQQSVSARRATGGASFNTVPTLLKPKRSAVSKTRHPKTRSQKKQESSPAITPFRLLDLPQELIDLVYKRMLEGGHFQILDTSHSVRARTLEFFDSHAVHRIVVKKNQDGDCNWVDAPILNSDLASMIKNVEIRITSEEQYPRIPIPTPQTIQPARTKQAFNRWGFELGSANRDTSNYSQFTQFDGSEIPRSSCHVIIETEALDADESRIEAVLNYITQFRGFARLSVIYSPKPTLNLYGVPRPLPSQKRRMAMYRLIKDDLEELIGPATPVAGDPKLEGGLEFYPRKYVESCDDDDY